jgi:hypothetical protein
MSDTSVLAARSFFETGIISANAVAPPQPEIAIAVAKERRKIFREVMPINKGLGQRSRNDFYGFFMNIRFSPIFRSDS